MRALAAVARFVWREFMLIAVTLTILGCSGSPPAQAADNYNILSPGNINLTSNQIGSSTTHSPSVNLMGGTDATEGNKAEVTSAGALKTDSSHVTQPVSFADNFLVNTELPAAAALADGAANPTVPFVGGFMMRWNGSTWDRWDGRFLPPASAPGATQYIVVRCSDGTIFESCGGSGGAGGTSSNFGSAFPTPGTAIGFSDGTNMQGGRAVDADTGGGTVYVQGVNLLKRASGGPVEAGTSTDPLRIDPTNATPMQTVGPAAHDAAASGNPVLVGGVASIDEPTAVSADGDVAQPWFSRFGQPIVLIGHGDPEAPVSVNATASGNTTVIAAPGGTTKLCIQKGSVHNSAAANVTVLLQDGAAGTTRWAAELAAEGGGSLFDFGARGWCLTDNTLLNVNLSGASDVRVNITEYYIIDLP